MNEQNEKDKSEKVGFFTVVLSAMLAALGVQNRKNLERDFAHSSPFPFIVAGVVFTFLFVVGMIFLVKTVLGSL